MTRWVLTLHEILEDIIVLQRNTNFSTEKFVEFSSLV